MDVIEKYQYGIFCQKLNLLNPLLFFSFLIHSYFLEWHKKIIHSNHNGMKAAILEMYDSDCLSNVKGIRSFIQRPQSTCLHKSRIQFQ